jgi:hypothetical protein
MLRVALVAAISLGACKKTGGQRWLSDEQTSEAEALVGKLRAARAAAQSFPPLSVDTLAKAVPGDAPCPITLRLLDTAEIAPYVTTGQPGPAWVYVSARPNEPITETNMGETGPLAAVARGLVDGNVRPQDLAELRELAKQPVVSVFLVELDRTSPTVKTDIVGLGLRPGKLSATAYVYVHDAQRIACVGQVTAQSSESIAFTYQREPGAVDVRIPGSSEGRDDAQQAALRDFDVNIRRAIVASLRAVR